MVVRRNLWWTVSLLAITALLGIVVGPLSLWLAYAVFNLIGVWFYCDHHGPRRQGRQRWIKVLAILQLPVGLIGLLASGGGTDSSFYGDRGADGDQAIAMSKSSMPPPGPSR